MKELSARAPQKLDTELAAIWPETRPSRKGLSPLGLAMQPDSGLRISLEELGHRSVNKNRIPVIQEEFRVWVEKKSGLQGLRFIQRGKEGMTGFPSDERSGIVVMIKSAWPRCKS